MDDPCRSERACLASQGTCRVERCRCGTIHLTFGALTMRLQQEAFESFVMLLNEAAALLVSESDGSVEDDDDFLLRSARGREWS
jgi:hypothetical protein